MPGIFGVTKNNKKEKELNLHSLNLHIDSDLHFKRDFDDEQFTQSIIGFDFMQDYQFFFNNEELKIWVYGDPLLDDIAGEKAIKRVAEIVRESYPSFKPIANIDGLFTIVVLDRIHKKLCIIGDRNGLSPVYYGVFEDQLIFGSELRAFISPEIKTSIRSLSIETFLNLRNLIGNETWFNEVNLLPPSAFLVWDIESKKIEKINEYWSYKNLKPFVDVKTDKEIIEDLALLFKKAVSKRVNDIERVGITLSGGLDSRMLFANIPIREKGFTAITRGQINAGDIKIASQVVQLRDDCNHILFNMNSKNWDDHRVEAVKATSGQKDFFNMNALASLPIHKQYFDINLDGAGGDGLFQGVFQNFKESPERNQKLKAKYFHNYILDSDEVWNHFIEYYEDIDSDQYFFMYQVMRRFSIFGAILGHDYGIISRFPFLDHELQEYVYRLPKNANLVKLYRYMMIEKFPQYFVEIDNLHTGFGLSKSERLNYLKKIWFRGWEKFGYKKYERKYHDYPKWIKENGQNLLSGFVYNTKGPLYTYVPYEKIQPILERYKETGEGAANISKILTLNIFLEYYKKVRLS